MAAAFAQGETKPREYVERRIQIWDNRWKKRDPFAGLSVYLRDTEEFLGHIVLGHGDSPGISELAYLYSSKILGKEIWQ